MKDAHDEIDCDWPEHEPDPQEVKQMRESFFSWANVLGFQLQPWQVEYAEAEIHDLDGLEFFKKKEDAK